MSQYHKINGVFKRYTKDNKKDGTIPEGKVWGEFKDGEWAQDEFEYLKDTEWQWTEKVDGMNVRIVVTMNDWDIRLFGKTDKAEIPKGLSDWFEDWVDKNGDVILEMFDNVDEVILYGEGIGPKIQKGKHGFTEYGVILFDVKIGKFWLKREHVDQIGVDIGLPTVPIVERATLNQAIEDMRSRAELKKERTSSFGDWPMEGIVGVPTVGLLSRSGDRIITKLKYSDFRPKTHKESK
jgi:hypothetical protein